MKSFNKTYLKNGSKKETIIMIDFIYRQLIEKLNTSFELINVSPPIFDKIDSPYLLNFDDITRPINIDLLQEYQIITFYQSLSRWAQYSILTYDIDIDKGIIFQDNQIWRDLSAHSQISQHKSYIHIELSVNPKSNKKNLIKKITNKIYKIIFLIAEELNEKYKLKNIFPKNIEFIEAQLLENEFPNLNSFDKEEEIAQELHAFVLMQPGKKLLSGKIHSKRSNDIYDVNHFNEIHLLNQNKSASINVASISYKLFGKHHDTILKYQANKASPTMIIDELVKEPVGIQTIEVKINIFKLYLILLRKGHIAEVQPNVISKEVKQLKNQNMIEPL